MKSIKHNGSYVRCFWIYYKLCTGYWTALVTYNEAVKKYDAGLIDEATFTIAEKSYEQFKNLLNRYDTLYSLIFLHFF